MSSYTLEEIKAAGLDDFRVFLIQVWDYLGLPPPTPVQLDIAYNLQHGPRRMIVQAFRGVGKSWITVAFVLWLLLLNPQLKIEVVSASKELANDFSKFAKQLIHGMPMLQHLAPREGQRDSAISFDVGPATESKDPSVKSAGINGQITGTRADVIIADDVEVPKNSFTHHLREKLAYSVTEFDAVLKPGGRVIYLGTPQVEDSLYNKLEQKFTEDGEQLYHTMVWPAEIPANVEVYRGRLAAFVMRRIERGAQVGDPVCTRFSKMDLSERRASYGETGYALQFMLDTNPASAEKHPLKLRDLIVMDVHDELGPVQIMWSRERQFVVEDLAAGGLDGDCYYRPSYRSEEHAKWNGTVCAIDPSGRGKDETGVAIARFLHGQIYLVYVGGFLDGYGEATLKTIAAKCAQYKVNYVIVEENFGGGMFSQLLKPYLARVKGGTIDDEWDGWSRGQKEIRICDTMEPLVTNHKLTVDRRVIEDDLRVQGDNRTSQYSFVQQFTRMERIKGALPHEDRLEAVAMACGYFVDRMDRDQEKALKAHRDSLMDAELRRFRDNVFNVSKPTVPQWNPRRR